ncbi:MAG: permease [Saccharofermentanales bacterium]|jgi:putative transport protein|nr:permease [Clostridiaceae bacterium]
MSTIVYIFIIAALGYLLGSLSIKGLNLGTSGVLLVALVFGHFGVEIPVIVRNLGLALFVGAVGLIAGPVFFRNLKKKVYVYMALGIMIVLSASVFTLLIGKLLKIPAALAIGVFTGALTSTPGLAAALEATGDSLASVGYGIAYPFGVVGVVLFVQLLPRILRTDIAQEAEALKISLHGTEEAPPERPLKTLETSGLLIFSVALAIGLLLGGIRIPLPGGMSFSFGTAGGPLFSGLIIGHFSRIGNINIRIPQHTLKTMREFGLCLFLLGAGTDAGAGFLEVLRQNGLKLFFAGILITLLPMLLACLVARLLFKLDTLTTLGLICGGMTSTPALGALITTSKTEDVAASYAATYPFALICMVLLSQALAAIW